MRPLRYVFLTLLLIAVVIACMVRLTIYMRHGLGSESYIVPLAGDIGVRRENLTESEHYPAGSYQLVEVTDPRGHSFSEQFKEVRRVAVVKSFVVGETVGGFFIVDSAAREYVEPKLIESRDAWQQALVSAGLPRDIALIEPDTLAAHLPNSILRSSRMRVMRGALSLTDQEWEGVLIIGSWLFMLLFGTFAAKRFIVPMAVVAGLFSIGFARLFLGDAGPDLIAGIFDPFVAIGCGYLGRLVGGGIRRVLATGRAR